MPSSIPFPRREVRWERMFRDELEAAFHEHPVVFFPYGLCEPHGPGLVVGLDGLTAHGTACAAARVYGGIVAPAWFWHIAGMGGEAIWARDAIGEVERSWLTMFPPWLFLKSMLYHARTAEQMGFKAAIFLSGHFGPLVDDMKRVISLLQPYTGTRLLVTQAEDLNPIGMGEGLGQGGHAGMGEMSQLWALDPSCVDFSRLPPSKTENEFGMAADIYAANWRTGEEVIERIARALGEAGKALVSEFDSLKPAHTFIRFEQVEQFWEAEMQPILYELNTMQVRFWDDQQDIDPSSVWYPNWMPPKHVT